MSDDELRVNQLTELGLALFEHFQVVAISDFQSQYKSANDAVTSVDLSLEREIRTELQAIDPDVRVFSEEQVTAGPKYDDDFFEEPCWLVDPLDGTSNFIQGLEITAVSLARVVGCGVEESLVVDLRNGDVYVAILGGGAYRNRVPLGTTVGATIGLVGASTGFLKSLSGDELESCLSGRNFRVLGSQALHLCMVAVGVFQESFSVEARAWDDAAGSLIVSESGGSYASAELRESRGWLRLALEDKPMNSHARSKTHCATRIVAN